MAEMTAVLEHLDKTTWYWLGGKYNSTSGKYYWVGSGEGADLPALFRSHTPSNLSNKNLVLIPKREEINAEWLSSNRYYTLCEEY